MLASRLPTGSSPGTKGGWEAKGGATHTHMTGGSLKLLPSGAPSA